MAVKENLEIDTVSGVIRCGVIRLIIAVVQWNKWKDCNPRPDPDRENELNAYLDTWASEDEPLLADAMSSTQYCSKVSPIAYVIGPKYPPPSSSRGMHV